LKNELKQQQQQQQQKTKKSAGGLAQMVEHLPNNCEALCSIPNGKK
jgi:hypothetical protein